MEEKNDSIKHYEKLRDKFTNREQDESDEIEDE